MSSTKLQFIIPKGTNIQPVYGRFTSSTFMHATYNLGFARPLNRDIVVNVFPKENEATVTMIPDSLRGTDSLQIYGLPRMYKFSTPLQDQKNILFRGQVACGFIFDDRDTHDVGS